MNLGFKRLPGPKIHRKILRSPSAATVLLTGHSSRLVLIIIRIRLDTAAAQRMVSLLYQFLL